MQLQLGVVVFQLDLDDDFFAAHGNIGDFGFQNSRHRLRWDFVLAAEVADLLHTGFHHNGDFIAGRADLTAKVEDSNFSHAQ